MPKEIGPSNSWATAKLSCKVNMYTQISKSCQGQDDLSSVSWQYCRGSSVAPGYKKATVSANVQILGAGEPSKPDPNPKP